MSDSGSAALSLPISRARMIAERQRRYPVWRLIHLLGSLKLALLLLSTIAIACAVATFTESRFDATVARALIYKAPWFIAWLGVLCINLFAVTLTRWPWQRKHTGFIITHYGIITLLIGAVIGSKLGFEGNVTLRTDGQPQRRIITDRSTLQIESPADSYLYLLPFDAKLFHPTEKHPRRLTIPGTDLVMVVDGSSEHLARRPLLEKARGNAAGNAVLLRFSSRNLNQTLTVGLGTGEGSADKHDFFGLASISFLKTLPNEPAKEAAGGGRMLTVEAGASPTEGISLSKDGSLVTLHSSDGLSASYRRSEIVDQEISLGSLHAIVRGFNLNGSGSFKNKVPISSILIERTDGNDETIGTDATSAETGHPESGDTRPWLKLALGPQPSTLAYQLGRSGEMISTGVLRSGDQLPLGWADWQVKLVESGKGLAVSSVMEPTESSEQGGLPGFHAYLRDPLKGTEVRGDASWVASGEVTPLLLGENLVRVGYGLELRPIPFSIALTDFQVPRDEGTETPSDFRANVQFKNLKTGEEKSGLIRMNHPASYPGGFLANMTGINYKFSQAEWNPRDLKETTLQVLYDPGWFFKWTGSLAICIGIATMFYIRPRS